MDYVNTSGSVVFKRGDAIKTHTIVIQDDDECELTQPEGFVSAITTVGSIFNIRIAVSHALIVLDDSEEFECGKCLLGFMSHDLATL